MLASSMQLSRSHISKSILTICDRARVAHTRILSSVILGNPLRRTHWSALILVLQWVKDNGCGTQRALFCDCEQNPRIRISVYNNLVLPMNTGSEYRNSV